MEKVEALYSQSYRQIDGAMFHRDMQKYEDYSKHLATLGEIRQELTAIYSDNTTRES